MAAKPPPTYSQAVKAAGLVFVSGTAPVDPVTGQMIAGTAAEQTAQVSSQYCSHPGGGRVKSRKSGERDHHLDDPDDFSAFNEEWSKWFPTNPPARQGAKLPRPRPRAQNIDRNDRRGMTHPGGWISQETSIGLIRLDVGKAASPDPVGKTASQSRVAFKRNKLSGELCRKIAHAHPGRSHRPKISGHQ